MKLYSASGASISMAPDNRLKPFLSSTLAQYPITHVIETGTFRGLGSTTRISESFAPGRTPGVFVTIEANWVSWCHAKRNLRRFPFVQPLWGQSVAQARALAFIESDEALHHHARYPDIFIDDIADPVRFYRDEILGKLGAPVSNPKYLLRRCFDRAFAYSGEDLLEKHLTRFREHTPLVVLDSAGGIGYLEFQILRQVMQAHPYLLLLDDIHHLKHFRSHRDISQDRHFEQVHVDEQEGWLFAKYRGA